MTVLFDFPFNVDKTTLSAKELIMQEVILTISMLCYFFIKKSNPFSLANLHKNFRFQHRQIKIATQ